MPVESSRDILTIDQAADVLQVSPIFVRRMIKAGDLCAARFGKFWRISRAEILKACSRPGNKPGRKVRRKKR